MLWDIYCRVIDNHGDIGVCWRLSCALAAQGQLVRLWVDDASALKWMAPGGHPGVQVLRWFVLAPAPLAQLAVTQRASPEVSDRSNGFNAVDVLDAPDVLVEAFGCEIAPEIIAVCADSICSTGRKCLWINLEYLTAQSYAERSHGLPSPVLSGPGRGMTKHFFYPGFSGQTGGLLHEANLAQRQAEFGASEWLAAIRLRSLRPPGNFATPSALFGAAQPQIPPAASASASGSPLRVSLFCYEPGPLDGLLRDLAALPQGCELLVCAGRPAAAVEHAIAQNNRLQPIWNERMALSILYLPLLSQVDFDHLLWSCDLNFVRGEDSLVRALWAGKALVWQPYPQTDGAHLAKLAAFLDALGAPAALAQWHWQWNVGLNVDTQIKGQIEGQIEAHMDANVDSNSGANGDSYNDAAAGHCAQYQRPTVANLPPFDLPSWTDWVLRQRAALWSETDLCSQLIAFVTRSGSVCDVLATGGSDT